MIIVVVRLYLLSIQKWPYLRSESEIFLIKNINLKMRSMFAIAVLFAAYASAREEYTQRPYSTW